MNEEEEDEDVGSEVGEGEKVFIGYMTDIKKSHQPPSQFHHPISFQNRFGVSGG